MKHRDIYWRRYKIQETLFIGQWHLSPLQIRQLGTLQFSQHLFHCSQHAAKSFVGIAISWPVVFPESHRWFEISSLSKMILVLGKARSPRAPILGCRGRGPESPVWCDVLPKNFEWNMMHEWVRCCDEAANHQLPIAAALWIIRIVLWRNV